jgi:hypothetical protein
MPGTSTSFSYSILGQGKIILGIACLSWHLSNEIATATEYTVYCASKSSVINRCAADTFGWLLPVCPQRVNKEASTLASTVKVSFSLAAQLEY